MLCAFSRFSFAWVSIAARKNSHHSVHASSLDTARSLSWYSLFLCSKNSLRYRHGCLMMPSEQSMRGTIILPTRPLPSQNGWMDSNSAWAIEIFTSEGMSSEFTKRSHAAMASSSLSAAMGT